MDIFNKKKLKGKDIIIETKRQEIVKLMIDKNNLLKSNEHLMKVSEDLQKENKKLIEWIEKIINEVGVKTNCKDININIPYYEDVRYEENRIEGNYENDYFPRYERRDIIVPSIRFTKFIYKE